MRERREKKELVEKKNCEKETLWKRKDTRGRAWEREIWQEEEHEIGRAQESKRDQGRKRNEETRSEWEGNGTLTIILTLSFIQLLNEIICCPIMNKKDVKHDVGMTFFSKKKMYI